MGKLERIVRPIVEGQIRGFLKEHPEIIESVTWFKPRAHDKATTFTNSLAKRIVRDLVCDATRARLENVFLKLVTEKTNGDALGTDAEASP